MSKGTKACFVTCITPFESDSKTVYNCLSAYLLLIKVLILSTQADSSAKLFLVP